MVMEASSVMMMNPSSSSSSSCCFNKHASSSSSSLYKRSLVNMGGFCDKGQLEYYGTSIRIRCGGEKKGVKVEQKKKKNKLVKGLYRDLSLFYGMGFGLESAYDQQKEINHDGVVDEVKLKMKEAAELLLEQLKQVKGEDKELKKKMKMEEKKKMKAEKKSAMSVSLVEASSSSSSSSSESSDSESDDETVVDLKSLKGGFQLPQQQQSLRLSSVSTPAELPVVPTLQEDLDVSLLPTTTAAVLEEGYRREADVASGIAIIVNQEKNRIGAELGGMVGKKIEVCMGGKCKKSGAATLVDEFQRVVGFNPDITVSGCKCMGKCKEGPNVRVVNTPTIEDVPVAMAMTPKNPLCLGVGVEDVGLIVSSFFEDETHQTGVMGVPAPAF